MRRQGTLTKCEKNYYEMSPGDVERSIRESSAQSLHLVRERGSLPNVTVICDPNYCHDLIEYYHWGERSPQNFLEDISGISGQIFYEGDHITIVPRYLLKMVSERRTKTSVTTSTVNKQGADYQNHILNECLSTSDCKWMQQFGELQIEGRCHSHPDLGSIGVRPSGIDVNDHRNNMSSNELWLSQIVDPVRCMSAFYFGPGLQKPQVIYCLYASDFDRFRHGSYFSRRPPRIQPIPVREILMERSVNQPEWLPPEEPIPEIAPANQPAKPSEPSSSTSEEPVEQTDPNDTQNDEVFFEKPVHSKKDLKKKKNRKMRAQAVFKACMSSETLLALVEEILYHSAE